MVGALHAAQFVGAEDDGGGADNCSYTTYKAPVNSSPSTTNTRLFTGQMPFLFPNQQHQSTEGKSITLHGLSHPSSTGVF